MPAFFFLIAQLALPPYDAGLGHRNSSKVPFLSLFFFSLLLCYSILAVLGVPMHFVHVLDPGSPNFDLLMTIWTFCASICIDLGVSSF